MSVHGGRRPDPGNSHPESRRSMNGPAAELALVRDASTASVTAALHIFHGLHGILDDFPGVLHTGLLVRRLRMVLELPGPRLHCLREVLGLVLHGLGDWCRGLLHAIEHLLTLLDEALSGWLLLRRLLLLAAAATHGPGFTDGAVAGSGHGLTR